MIMDDYETKQLVEAAIMIGFTVSDHNELKCTHEQLVTFAACIAQEAMRQLENNK
jgi:hypothetical protein